MRSKQSTGYSDKQDRCISSQDFFFFFNKVHGTSAMKCLFFFPLPSGSNEAKSVYVSERQSLMVLSFSNAAEAMIFSVGWHAVHKTTSRIRNTTPMPIINIIKRTKAKSCNRQQSFTCVALKFLHDFLSLKIPDVDHVIFRTRNNPL